MLPPTSHGPVPGLPGASFERLIEWMPSPMWVADFDGRGLWVNRAWLQFCGVTFEQATTQPWTNYVHPEDYTSVAATCGTAVQMRAPFAAEARMRRHDGQWRWMLNHGVPFTDRDGTCIAYLGSLTDITERHEAQDRMKLVLDHLGAPAFLHTVDGVYLFVNKEWNLLFNPAGSTVVGRNAADFLPADQVREILRTNTIAVSTGKRYEYEVVLTTAEGPRAFLVKKFPLRDSNGALSILCGIATDLTEVRKREQHTLDLEAQLLESRHLESIGVLAGGVAHDFNNLMQAVLGYAGLAAADVPAGSPAREWITEVVRSATRAADLTRQLLDFAGRPSLVMDEADVPALLRHWEPQWRAVAPPGVRFELEAREPLPLVPVDTSRLQQLLAALVNNAIEALADGPGTITIRAGLEADGTGDAAALRCVDPRPEVECLYVEVNDTGHGMDEETAARVFEPFYSTRFAGRGLGLSAALGIARAHGGTIAFATAPGAGASFRVLLPVAQPSRSASRNAAP